MRRFVKLATVCIVAMLTTTTVFSLWPVAGRTNGKAAVLLPTRQMDLGIVTLQGELDVPFKLANQGTRRLVINELSSGCECSEPEHKAVCVAPGETVEVKVKIDTRFETGVFEKVTTFATNDPRQPQFELIVKGYLQPHSYDAPR